MDPLRDELPLYKKESGDFTLDGSETRKDVSRIEALAKISPAMETAFATKLVERMERPKGLMERMKAEETAESTPAELDKI